MSFMEINTVLAGRGGWGEEWWQKRGRVPKWGSWLQAGDQHGWGFATMCKEPTFQVRGFLCNKFLHTLNVLIYTVMYVCI
jgi:hypothetical protein